MLACVRRVRSRDERLGAAVELLVEAVDGRPGRRCRRCVHSQFGQRSCDLPVRRGGLLPLDRVDERRGRTRGRRAGRRSGLATTGAGGGGRRLVLEVDDLDRAARRGGPRGGRSGCCRAGSWDGSMGSGALHRSPRRGLERDSSSIGRIRQTLGCAYSSRRSLRRHDHRLHRRPSGPLELAIVLVIVLRHLRRQAAARARPPARRRDARVQGLGHEQGRRATTTTTTRARRRPGRARPSRRRGRRAAGRRGRPRALASAPRRARRSSAMATHAASRSRTRIG